MANIYEIAIGAVGLLKLGQMVYRTFGSSATATLVCSYVTGGVSVALLQDNDLDVMHGLRVLSRIAMTAGEQASGLTKEKITELASEYKVEPKKKT